MGLLDVGAMVFGLNTQLDPSMTDSLTELLTLAHRDGLARNRLIETLGNRIKLPPVHPGRLPRRCVVPVWPRVHQVTQRLQWDVDPSF